MLYCLNSNLSISCSLIFFSYIKGSLNISAHLSMKIILEDPTLVRIFFGNNFFDPNYFLVSTN